MDDVARGFIDFGREICCQLDQSTRREWLVTNGIGGYASGTVSGLLTRRYHGLLVAALKPPLGRTLLLAKLDETVRYAAREFPLFTNRWASGTLEPEGYLNLVRFRLEGTTPIWTYACADALLEKRVWMGHGSNTTYIHYRLVRASQPLRLEVKAIVNYRDHHGNTHAGDLSIQVERIDAGLSLSVGGHAAPYYLFCAAADAELHADWLYDYFFSLEADRGLDAVEDLFHAGTFRAALRPGDGLTFVASVEGAPNLDWSAEFAARRHYEQGLLQRAGVEDAPPWLRRLVLAADQFIVRRARPDRSEGYSVIAGYPWFGDWGRDTMISLPGLTLYTGRSEIARSLLETFSRYVDQGMLPNRFPEFGDEPEYNTVDATLWYFEALRAYHAETGDLGLVEELFPVLGEVVRGHQRGTRYGIRVDPRDGLLAAGEPGVQLTWMDAKVGEWVVTPRIGKPVEINALWYNAMMIMADFAVALGKPAEAYQRAARKARQSFSRFWNAAAGYCYDVLDGPEGDDPALRPNQLLAVSLPHSPLSPERQRAVVEVCALSLLTSHGLRSLVPGESAYVGRYRGDARQRDAAYHQGTAWAWLIGPFAAAHLRVHRDPGLTQSFLEPLGIHHLADHGLGSISEIFDGDPPHAPRGGIAQAWSVAEVLRLWQALRAAQEEVS